MEFGEKEKIIILAALNQYMKIIEKSLDSNETSEDDNAELVNDASLLEIIISRFNEEVNEK
ncbi:MAG: hypothetical protein L3J98_04455 [Gammaproteobacteria bacterium]|nr:hypothetical protein [Gammaproteobacteria bacterium]MCF6259402.1 hypothetical protein [Gammaproteobacteria bacterium]